MLDGIRSFFSEKMEPPEQIPAESHGATAPPALQVAACALLLEIAYSDEEFADSERAHLVHRLKYHVGTESAET